MYWPLDAFVSVNRDATGGLLQETADNPSGSKINSNRLMVRLLLLGLNMGIFSSRSVALETGQFEPYQVRSFNISCICSFRLLT